MKELHLPLIEALPEKLGLPERFGKVAVGQSVQLELDIPQKIVVGVE